MIRNKQYFYYSLNMGFKTKYRTTSFISMTCRSAYHILQIAYYHFHDSGNPVPSVQHVFLIQKPSFKDITPCVTFCRAVSAVIGGFDSRKRPLSTSV